MLFDTDFYLRLQVNYSDATVACDGKLYHVHKMVLSISSKYFDKMFTATGHYGKHPIIVLHDITSDVFDAILKFIYLGVVNVQQDMIAPLLNAAKSLKIDYLSECCDIEPTIQISGEQYQLTTTEDSSMNGRKRRKQNVSPQNLGQSEFLSKRAHLISPFTGLSETPTVEHHNSIDIDYEDSVVDLPRGGSEINCSMNINNATFIKEEIASDAVCDSNEEDPPYIFPLPSAKNRLIIGKPKSRKKSVMKPHSSDNQDKEMVSKF